MDKRTVILLLVMAALAVGSAVPYCSDRLADREPGSSPRSDPRQRQASTGEAQAGTGRGTGRNPFTSSAETVESERIQRGRDLMVDRCYGTCHSGAVVLEAHKQPQNWPPTVDRMVRYGARLESQERKVLIDFLMTLR